jgi:O-antigen ligase
MTTLSLDPSDARSLRAHGSDRLVRSVLFLAVFLQIWLTANPFPDLSDPKLLDPVGDGNLIGQVLAVLLTGSLGVFAVVNRSHLVLKAATPILVLTFLWFACSAVFSLHAGLAARRLVLAVFTIFQATVFLLLPQDRNHFARLLAAGALIVLALCYAGVIFAPEHAIHQRADLAEPELAGNWRGFFSHKNGAGASMGILIFFGIFICRSFNGVLGALIITLAAAFLFFTESKSPLALLPLVLLFSLVFVWLRGPIAKLVTLLSIPLVIGILTIGSVEFGAVYGVVSKLLSDPTFTGRSEIWRFALDHIAERPIVGFGYQAFWGTSELLNSWTHVESWGYRASERTMAS